MSLGVTYSSNNISDRHSLIHILTKKQMQIIDLIIKKTRCTGLYVGTHRDILVHLKIFAVFLNHRIKRDLKMSRIINHIRLVEKKRETKNKLNE